jgi:prophage DNA circulation protein
MREILDARYTSPSGKEAVFLIEKAQRNTELKTGVFVFPHRDGAHVQHQGQGARSFPLACIFSGPACMDEADAFEGMLIEKGVGELQHPAYGTIKVVPTGGFSREDDLVEGMNESLVNATFTETIVDEDAAALTETAADAIEKAMDALNEQSAADFAEGMQTDDISEQLAVTGSLEESSKSISNLQGLARSDKKTFADFITSAKQLKNDIQNLYKKVTNAAGVVESTYVKALNIGRGTLRLLRLPSRVSVTVSEKIQGYSKLTVDLINQFKNDPVGSRKIAQSYSAARLAITGSVASIAEGTSLSIAASASRSAGGVNNTEGVASRAEAVQAANTLVNLLESVQQFADTKTSTDAFVDSDSAAYLAFISLVRNSAKLILNASFSLPLQKTITLGRDRQVVELCAELYGEVDGRLDEFIALNNFSIDEIELIPMGRRVSYYVQNA